MTERDHNVATCANGRTVLEVGRDWIDAAARCDVEAIAAGMAEDCKRYGEPEWLVIEKDDYIASYRQYLVSFSDYALQVTNCLASGRTVIFEMIESATFSKPYPLPDGIQIQPNGQSYTDRVCTLLEIGEDGLITQIRAYIPSNRGRLFAQAIAAMEQETV